MEETINRVDNNGDGEVDFVEYIKEKMRDLKVREVDPKDIFKLIAGEAATTFDRAQL